MRLRHELLSTTRTRVRIRVLSSGRHFGFHPHVDIAFVVLVMPHFVSHAYEFTADRVFLRNVRYNNGSIFHLSLTTRPRRRPDFTAHYAPALLSQVVFNAQKGYRRRACFNSRPAINGCFVARIRRLNCFHAGSVLGTSSSASLFTQLFG